MSPEQLSCPSSGTALGSPGSSTDVVCWYAVQMRGRFEKKVTAELEAKGIEAYLPAVKQVHRWSDRRQVVVVPLFPGYGFVHVCLTPKARLTVIQSAGVIGFVRFQGEPVPVPDKQVEDIKRILSQDLPCAMFPFLRVGQKVRIRGGCLDGIEGMLAERSSDKTLLIAITAIQRTIAIEISNYDIEIL